MIYLDYNATTPVAPEVARAMQPFLGPEFGNPSCDYPLGLRARDAMHQARREVAAALNCAPDEVVFTSGATEANNLVLKGVALSRGAGRIITAATEHPAVLAPCRFLASRGFEVMLLPVDSQGLVDPEAVRRALTPDTILISIMHANNETGALAPIKEIAALAREAGVPLHTDAAQSVGKVRVDVEELGVDFLTVAGHKFYAPKGVGGLFIRRGLKIRPFLIGGHQERSRRGGTENLASIVALGRAAELAASRLTDEATRVRALRDRLEKGILTKIPNAEINGDPDRRVPNTTNIGIHFIEGEALLLALDKQGICASTGSACASGSLQPSHVLRAMGVPFTCVHGSLRFSLSAYTTQEEVDYVLETLPGIVGRLRELSPFRSLREIEAFGA